MLGRAAPKAAAQKPPGVRSLDLDFKSYSVHGAKIDAPTRYTVLEPIGQGAYGVVCSAVDEQQGRTVAIKKIENTFEHLTFAKRTLRELRIMRHLRHENLIDVQYVYMHGFKEKFEDVYFVTELMETDLASILKSPQPLSDDHCQFFLYQILRALKFLHSAAVIHRDLKPRNLLVNSNCDLKVCDYGLARVYYEEEDFIQCPVTEYVCTRWYRAPEILCSWSDYSKPIDMWSTGCIFAEMMRRKALFPGRNTQHQLQLIIGTLGTPDRASLRRIPNDKCRRFIESLPQTTGRELTESVPGATPQALDLLQRMLQFHPDRRHNVGQALQHQYLAGLHCPEDEPERGPLPVDDFEFERHVIDLRVLREEVFLEALLYHPQKLEQHKTEQLACTRPYNIKNFRLLEPGESQYTSDDDD